MMVEEKIDGIRGVVLQGIDGITRMFTRKGYDVEGTAHILYFLSHMERLAGERMVWDGEFQVGCDRNATKHWADHGWKQGGEAGHFYLFDCLPLANWKSGGDATPLYERKARLQALHKAVAGDDDLQWEYRPGSRGDDGWVRSVLVLPDTWAFDPASALSEARRIWARGGEGIVLKDAEAPYVRERNGHFLKMTRENALRWGAGF